MVSLKFYFYIFTTNDDIMQNSLFFLIYKAYVQKLFPNLVKNQSSAPKKDSFVTPVIW